MTPDALRAAIASARLRPRMYAQTAEHLASMLYGMIAGAAPDGVDIGPAWGDAYSPADPFAPTDAEVCDAAEATVAAPWPQGDAPAGDECAAFSDVPLDTPMPPSFVAALASLSPAPFDLPDGDECFRTGDDAGRLRNLLAVIHRDGGHHVERVGIAQACCDAAARVLAAYHAGDAPARRAAEVGALDLDEIEARAAAAQAGPWRSTWPDPNDPNNLDEPVVESLAPGLSYAERMVVGTMWHDGSHAVCGEANAAFIAAARADVPALVARVRELEAQPRPTAPSLAAIEGWVTGARADARVRELESEVAARLACADHVRDEIRAAAKSADVPGGDEVAIAKRMANCIRRLRTQLAAALPAADLDAIRNGRAVTVCCVCSAEWPVGVRDCPGCGHPDRAAGAMPVAAQPAPLDFHGALAAVRNGRFVPSSAWARCLACDGTCADVDGAPCEPCRGTGRHPPPDPAEATDDVFEEFARAWNADTDLCAKCGALDLDHAVEECARRWAEQHPGAAAGIVGAERAPREST